MTSVRVRKVRRIGCCLGALVFGVIGYLWPGGPNVLMLLGAFMLFVAFLLDEAEVSENA